jgi:hypothetical protein
MLHTGFLQSLVVRESVRYSYEHVGCLIQEQDMTAASLKNVSSLVTAEILGV